ncbi:MAG: hypothetical protein OQK97_10155 [Deltaproteobacteria bacterium]|nr:hypothetical protein [Deltaproteobacteria bacterium]
MNKLAIYILLGAFLCGCVSKHSLLVEQRSSFGRIALVSASYVPEFEENISHTRGEGFTKGAAAGAGAPLSGLVGDPYGCIVAIFLVPICALGGGVYGVVASDTSEQAQVDETTILNVIHQRDIQIELRKNVYNVADQLTAYHVEMVDDIGPKEFDSILEVSLLKFSFLDSGVSNVNVTLRMEGSAQLIQVSGGEKLFDRLYDFKSEKRTLAEWADGDGELFRQEIEGGLLEISKKIVDDLFVRK